MIILALIIVMLLSLALGFLVAYLVFCRLLNPSVLWKKPYPDYKSIHYCEDFGSKFDGIVRDVNAQERRINSMNNDIQMVDRSLHDNFVLIKKLEEKVTKDQDYLCTTLEDLELRVSEMEDNKND